MRNSKQHCSNIFRELCIKAEDLAANNNETVNNLEIEVVADEIPYEFTVDVIVENYKHEEETQSTSYNSTVFVHKIPKTDNEAINEFLLTYVLNEEIYKD